MGIEKKREGSRLSLDHKIKEQFEAAELNRATLDNFLLEHPGISERAVLDALRRIATVFASNSKTPKL